MHFLLHTCWQIWLKSFMSFYVISKWRGKRHWTNSPIELRSAGLILNASLYCLDLYRSLWTAVRGWNSEFGLFQHTLRVLSGPPTPYQALMLTTKTTEYIGANGWDHFHFQNNRGQHVAFFSNRAGLTTTHIGACRATLLQPLKEGVCWSWRSCSFPSGMRTPPNL